MNPLLWLDGRQAKNFLRHKTVVVLLSVMEGFLVLFMAGFFAIGIAFVSHDHLSLIQSLANILLLGAATLLATLTMHPRAWRFSPPNELLASAPLPFASVAGHTLFRTTFSREMTLVLVPMSAPIGIALGLGKIHWQGLAVLLILALLGSLIGGGLGMLEVSRSDADPWQRAIRLFNRWLTIPLCLGVGIF